MVGAGEKRPASPKGVFNILTGNSSAIGKVLCEIPPFVRRFYRSTEVGKDPVQEGFGGSE